MLWFSGMVLAWEAAKVIEARLHLIAQGKCTLDEMRLMVSEKLGAFDHACSVVTRGGDPELIVDNYRKIIAANVDRLRKK